MEWLLIPKERMSGKDMCIINDYGVLTSKENIQSFRLWTIQLLFLTSKDLIAYVDISSC